MMPLRHLHDCVLPIPGAARNSHVLSGNGLEFGNNLADRMGNGVCERAFSMAAHRRHDRREWCW
jgi:hypothetical protein